jgi:DNA-binding transcriptional LysR family regulator
VVDAGSFSAAAERLHLSQPALSMAITKLESMFGIELLERSTRGVRPTAVGRHLVGSAARILGDVDDLIDAVAAFRDGARGTLTIAAVPVLMWHHLPVRLRAFTSTRELEVRLFDPPPWDAIDDLRQHSVDVSALQGADTDDFTRRYGDEFVIQRWRPMPLVGVFPADDAPDGTVELAEFAHRELVQPQRTTALESLPELVERGLADAGVQPARLRTVSTIQVSLPLIQAGLAASILPDPGGDVFARSGLVARPLGPALPPLHALLLSRRTREWSPVVEQFLALAE